MLVLREVTWISVLLRPLIALILGGMIGLEREMKNRPAGLRTYMLVCMGACLIMLTNQYIYQLFGTGDPVRMGAQVVSGIGFLGAGTIMVTRRNQIKGLTTAAGLWASAAVGLAVGIGFYEGAVVCGVAVFLILIVLTPLDRRVHRRIKVMEIYVELQKEASLGQFMQDARQLEVEFESVQIDHESAYSSKIRPFIITLKLRHRKDHIVLLEDLRSLEGVLHVEEL